MEQYDVIIVGGGPAGLMCAEILGKSDLKVLLLEKNGKFGEKVCAGGLTRKDMKLLDIPDNVIEHKITKTAVHSRRRKSSTNAPEAFVFTVNRITFGTWQRNRLKNTGMKVMTNAKVTKVDADKIIVNNSDSYGYKYLVGADGYSSVVRKYLEIPQEKRLIGLQYTVPTPDMEPKLEIFFDNKKFYAWYAWIFPHDKSIAVGCVADPRKIPSRKLKENFHLWLEEKGIDISNAKYDSYPISYDYRGLKFGNIFLAGEAAGMASGFTGEGIYQSLVSGKTVAEMIMNKNYSSKDMQAVIKYNAIQERIMNVLLKAGPLSNVFHELIVMILNNKYFKAKINKGFS